jgi:FLVCR family feline leukemia virus subgroup C receptor-related protein
MTAGPIQPINAELAVDVTYPSDETAVESVQQIGGNLASALLVPLAEIGARQDYQLLPNIPSLASDIRGNVILLAAIAIFVLDCFPFKDVWCISSRPCAEVY